MADKNAELLPTLTKEQATALNRLLRRVERIAARKALEDVADAADQVKQTDWSERDVGGWLRTHAKEYE